MKYNSKGCHIVSTWHIYIRWPRGHATQTNQNDPLFSTSQMTLYIAVIHVNNMLQIHYIYLSYQEPAWLLFRCTFFCCCFRFSLFFFFWSDPIPDDKLKCWQIASLKHDSQKQPSCTTCRLRLCATASSTRLIIVCYSQEMLHLPHPSM